MPKVRRTNISKKMKIEEIIGIEEQLDQDMLSFFEREGDKDLREGYRFLKESKKYLIKYKNKLKK